MCVFKENILMPYTVVVQLDLIENLLLSMPSYLLVVIETR